MPLIAAVAAPSLDHVKLLIEGGADPLKPSCVGGDNALESAVARCGRHRIDKALPIVEYLAGLTRTEQGAQPGDGQGASSVLGGLGWFGEMLRTVVSGVLNSGSPQPAPGSRTTPVYPVTDKIRSQVRKHGESLEGSRFARAQRDRTAEEAAEFARFEAGVRRLSELFSVPPVPVIPVVGKHDGVSPIHVSGADWDAQYRQLWHMLVLDSGPAATVQGEVVRIVGRLRHEIEGNGGGNWDDDFRAMQDAFPSRCRWGRRGRRFPRDAGRVPISM